MMVSCPKCGFTQPQDRYCANCGVDMLNYRPAQAPFMVRLLKSVLFQILILTLMIGGGFSYIRYKNRMALEARIATIENASDTRLIEQRLEKSESASQSATLAEQAAQPSAGDEKTDAAAVAPAALSEKGSRVLSDEPQPVGANASAPAPGGAPAAQSPTSANGAERPAGAMTLQVRFVEVNRKLLSDLTAEAKETGGFGSFITGVLPSAEARLKPSLDFRYLEDEPFEQALSLNQPAVVFRGMRDEGTGVNLGLSVNVTPTAIDETGIHVQVEAYRVLREPPGSNPPVGEQAFTEQFTIPRGGAAFMAGTFPRRAPLPPDDRKLYGGNKVLRILNSDAFQNGTNEFVILIEPK